MSFPASHPLVASLLPVSPDCKLLFWNAKAAVGLTPQQVQTVVERARAGEFSLEDPELPYNTPLQLLTLAVLIFSSCKLLLIYLYLSCLE